MINLKDAINEIYDLTEPQLLGLAVKIKAHPEWREEHAEDFPIIKEAFERVLAIRDSERQRVCSYYRSGYFYDTTMTPARVKDAYLFLRLIKDRPLSVEVSIKRAIREYTNRPVSQNRIISSDTDGFVELRKLPRFDSLEEADAYFKENIYMEITPSLYDCTGQLFTNWYKLFHRGGCWWAYHSVGRDV